MRLDLETGELSRLAIILIERIGSLSRKEKLQPKSAALEFAGSPQYSCAQ